MQTVGGIIKYVSGQLNDQQVNREYNRWTRTDLLNALNLALSAVSTYRKDAFTGTVAITLVPGSRQTSTGYSEIVEIVSNADGRPAHKADVSILKAFSAYDYCPPKIQFKDGKAVYSAKSAGVDPTDPKTFYVSPPVPVGMTAAVLAKVVKNAPTYTLTDWDVEIDIDERYINNLVDFMQARAHELDLESATAQVSSSKFYKQFYTALGVTYKMDSAFGSGFFKGEVGTGDPRAGA
jgi:hypothetical protein